MALTVQAALAEFHARIAIHGDHRRTVEQRRAQLLARLADHPLKVVDVVPAGAFLALTAVKASNRVDLLVVLDGRSRAQAPSALLGELGAALASEGLAKQGRAALVGAGGDGPQMLVFAALPDGRAGNAPPGYEVADAVGEGWLPSRPAHHCGLVHDAAARCGENLRRMIKMVKVWNVGVGEPILSYHLEVMATLVFRSYISDNDLPWALLHFFTQARALTARPLWHDGVQVCAYLSDDERAQALAHLDRAVAAARRAWCETFADMAHHDRAIPAWRALFGDDFPAYG